MRIPSGVTDKYIYFVAVDSTDLKTRETGLSSFTVYRSRNGGVAAVYTTPTINETDATNMPGVYEFLLDEDMTIDSGDDTQEICYHITHAGMAPVTRVIELYRPKITTGYTLSINANGRAGIDLDNTEGTLAKTTDITGFNDLSAAEVNAECDTALSDMFTSKAQLVDDIWDEDVDSSHQTVGSAGKKLDDAGSAGDPWGTALPGAYGAGTAGKIVGDNINAPISTVDTVVDGIKAVTDLLPNSGALTDIDTGINNLETRVPDTISLAAINAECDTALTDYDAPTRAELTSDKDEIITDLDDIKGTAFVKDTHSLINIEGYVDLIDDATSGLANIKTLIDTVNTDLSNGTDGLGALKTLIDTVNTDLSNGTDGLGALKTLIDAIDTVVDSIKLITDRQGKITIAGTAQTGTLSTTQMTTNLTVGVDDQYNGRILTFNSDTTTANLRNVQTDITDTVVSGGLLTFTAIPTAPVNGDTFEVT